MRYLLWGISAMSLDLKVIGAGMGRTGTTSLKAAMEMLLKGPCFHFYEYQSKPELMAPWLDLIRATPMEFEAMESVDVLISQWDTMMPGYVACMDEPASYYWKQLSDAFPEALVILSVRDTDAWWASCLAIEKSYEEERKRPELITAERRAYLDLVEELYPDSSKDIDTAYFEAHNRSVLEFAEQDESFKKRLLVWRTTDGWEPICNALNLPVPDIPFPHKNRSADFHEY